MFVPVLIVQEIFTKICRNTPFTAILPYQSRLKVVQLFITYHVVGLKQFTIGCILLLDYLQIIRIDTVVLFYKFILQNKLLRPPKSNISLIKDNTNQ